MESIEEYFDLVKLTEYNLNPQKPGKVKRTRDGLVWQDENKEAYTSDIAIQFGADESIECLLDNSSSQVKYRPASD